MVAELGNEHPVTKALLATKVRDIRDPDPDLTVADIFTLAKETIQTLVRKR